MTVKQIKQIEDLIHLRNGTKILDHKVSPLTKPGENYGSLILSVIITIQKSNKTEELHVVAKLVPPDECLQKVFNISLSFHNEIGFYRNIVPTLQNFQQNHGIKRIIDFTPKYFGSRLNLKGTTTIDSDAVLLLENLKINGFTILDQTKGVDFETSKLILADLAHLHAVSLGLKLQNPDIFQKEIVPYLMKWYAKPHTAQQELLEIMIEKIDEMKPLKQRIMAAFDKQVVPYEPREPFSTINHNDCWTKNNMIKFENGKPVENKLVDYQVCSYGSPARDLIFFLFTSLETKCFGNDFNELIKWYHEIFISVLKNVVYDTTPFSFEALEREIEYEAKNAEFGHIIFMLRVIFATREKVELFSMNHEAMLKLEPSDAHKAKFVFVVEEFVKRNWI